MVTEQSLHTKIHKMGCSRHINCMCSLSCFFFHDVYKKKTGRGKPKNEMKEFIWIGRERVRAGAREREGGREKEVTTFICAENYHHAFVLHYLFFRGLPCVKTKKKDFLFRFGSLASLVVLTYPRKQRQ